MLEKYNPWRPMTDPLDLKHMGKLAEEVNELGAATARCLIQGIDEAEPTTGKINRRWLEEEMADVYANMYLVANRFGLDGKFIEQRMSDKIGRLRTWHEMT